MEKKNDNGFTLIELLGIIVLLAILGLLVFKVIDSNLKNSKETAYEKQLSMIELSAKSYMSEHTDELPEVGGETYLTLGFMKIFGYSDLEIVNPINNRCFSNDLVVVITKPKTDADYVYEVDRSTIKEVNDCSVTNVSLEEPVVTISGGVDTVSQVEPGEVGNYGYMEAYNKSVDDKRAEDYIKISAPSPTDAEIQIGEEMGSENGYYRYVDVHYTGYMNSGAKLYLYIDEGFITNSTKKSSYVRSSDTYVMGDSPEIVYEVIDIVSLSEYLPSPIFKNPDELSYIHENYVKTACMSANPYTSSNGKYGTQVMITIQSPNKMNEYVEYDIIAPTGERSTYEKSVSEDKIALFLIENGTYFLSATDRFGNSSSFITIDIYHDDCSGPYKTKDLTGSDNITDYFQDDSGVRMVYVFAHSLSPDKLIKEFNEKFRSLYLYHGVDDITKLFGGQYIGKYADHYQESRYNYIENDTLDNIISLAKNTIKCGSYYIYFFVNDASGTSNKSLYAIETEYFAKKNNCSTDNSSSNEEICNYVCEMKINSAEWPGSDAEGKKRLNQMNLQISLNNLGSAGYYNPNTGVHYDCSDNQCKELYSGLYVDFDTSIVGRPVRDILIDYNLVPSN